MPLADSPPGLDLERLAAFLVQACPGLLGPDLHAELIAGGRSNLTYVVDDGERSVIVRRPPLGHVLATAHDMEREYRVITALRDTDVPVPRTYAVCPGEEVIGAPFYVMEHVMGRPLRRADELAERDPHRVSTIARRMVETLAALHHVDPGAVGLADFGRPEGFLERQVRRWGRQLEGSRSRDLAGADELHQRLGDGIPSEQPGTIVHGDFRLDNCLVDERDRITAVLDWEMATLGDPLTDVGLLVVYQGLADLAPDAVSDVSRAPGYPDVPTLLRWYEEASGRSLGDIGWYMAMGYYKLAVILEGIYYRHVHGQTVGEGYDSIGAFTEPLIQAGLTALEEN